MDRRAAQRIEAEIPIIFYGNRIEGEGVARNLSSSGALIQHATAPVQVGQRVSLELGLRSDLESIRVAARVVRLEGRGFAVQFLFDAPQERTRVLGLLDLLAAQQEGATPGEG